MKVLSDIFINKDFFGALSRPAIDAGNLYKLPRALKFRR